MEHHCVNTVKVERTVLYGEAVHNNRPPQETLLSDNEPVISFSKTDGTGFGLNLKQLSRGLLLCGETGCGKTTVINHCAESINLVPIS